MAKRWYVVRVQSGREGTVQKALARQLKLANLEAAVPRVLVPMEVVTELKGGQKRTRKKKLYPGYVLVEVEEAENKVPREIWTLVRDVSGVGDFVGTPGNPEPLGAKDAERLLLDVEKSEARSPQLKIPLKKGDAVKIREGALESFEGVVDDVMPAKGLVRVIVTIFGRGTPVDLEYWQVELL